MQYNRSTLGPRGWAIVTLISGAGLASPFLRPPQVDIADQVSESPMAPFGLPARFASARSMAQAVVPMSDPVDATPLGSLPGDSPLQSSPVQIPEWATPRSPLDDLISQGTAPPWRHEVAEQSPRLPPLAPWTNLPSTTPRQSSVLPQAEPLPASVGATPAPLGSLTTSTRVSPTPVTASVVPAPQSSPQPPMPRQFVFQPGYQNQSSP